ncbi:hypothetical protein [Paenibacillus apiarius]|uniref:Uncharacterized protein n=1 Tax=Paenibacillus apiarius TaxID=46240 RepID=A0ABT4DPH9_9BACL|nr:hypothetical protein [Paenibacillus apiarius]MBN3524772.1 hypothetical protein [Paenibacillus apiarius]MCY9515663.1 hypothetical protein [Paenibacillus apiarius]MCY9519264.1 hypothetical protein [Paenibacillus apiarius]MCY9550900.1 hypothetical protein [Paenibacillus apiarius]MCY9559008.1 hypothetical protein [Paenibacillus apiarius]
MNGSRWMRSKMYIAVWAVLAISLLLLIQGNGEKAISGVIVAGIVYAVVKYFGARQAEQSTAQEQRSYGILVICEQTDGDGDEIQHEDLLDEIFAAGNVDISYQCSAEELREWNPALDVPQLPCFMVLNGSSAEELEDQVKQPLIYSSNHQEVIRFIQENKL